MIKYFRFLLAVIVLGSALQILGQRTGSFVVRAEVDHRIELLSIVARLAEFREFEHDNFKTYAAAADKHFAAHRDHPLIEFIRELRQKNSIGFDAVPKMAVHLNPDLTPRVAFSETVPDSRWGKENAGRFAKLLRDFCRDADCAVFFASHADIYRTVERRFQEVLEKVDFDWYRKFYGEIPDGTFNLYLGLLNGGGNFGARVVHPDGTEDLYAVIGVWQFDEAGLPVFDDRYLPTIIHEYNHSFINQLVYEHSERLDEPGRRIYAPVAEKMSRLAYGNWRTTLIESLVRAAVVRYLLEHGEKAAYAEIDSNRVIGFLWIDELMVLLGSYENSRRSYPTLRSFMPLIAGYFEDLAKRIDRKAREFEEKTPRVTAVEGIENGAADVDPAITRITFVFDRPLETSRGHSIDYGPRGKQYFPIERVIGYSADGKKFTVEVKLEPAREYEFVLVGRRFGSPEGYPLEDYKVSFKTAKK